MLKSQCSVSIKVNGLFPYPHCPNDSPISFDPNRFSLRQKFFYFELCVSISCNSFVSHSWFGIACSAVEQCSNCKLGSGHNFSTKFPLCFIIFLIFLAEPIFALSKIENILIIAFTNEPFWLFFQQFSI